MTATSMAVGVTAINNLGNGISLGNLSSCVVANSLFANNGIDNLAMVSYSSAPSGNVLSQITALNATSDSMTLDKAAGVGVSYNTLSHITTMQQHQISSPFNVGLYLHNTDHTTLSDVVALNSETGVSSSDANGKDYDLTLWGNDTALVVSGNNNTFGGKLRQWNSTAAGCNVTGTGNNLNNSCAGAGVTSVTGFNLSGSYVGFVTDSVNTSNTNGQNAYASITDWTNFENPYRTWGPSGTGGFLDKSRVDRCASGTCQIYDTRLNVSDTVLRNVNGAFTNGAACPASINASIAANVITDTSGRTFLKNAVEIIGDGIGNENGLCESGEACIYAPNAGAYQGEGDYTAQTCTYTGGNGVINVTMYGYPTDGSSTVDPVYPVNGFNWNDYVTWTNKGGANTVFNQPDTACAGTEVNYMGGCIHGGEKRKYVVAGKTTCAGLSAGDSLGVFSWFCDASSGVATFYSKGLVAGKGLRDLVTGSSFIPNSLIVTLNGNPLVQSESAIWWGNPVAPLPVNRNATDAPVALTVPGQIYTLSASDSTSGYDIFGVKKVSIVTLGNSVLSYSGYATNWCKDLDGSIGAGNYAAILCAGTGNFGWIEGNFNGNNTSNQIGYFIASTFVRIRNSSFYNMNAGVVTTQSALDMDSQSNNFLLENISVYNNVGVGVAMYDPQHGILKNSIITNNTQQGLYLYTSGTGAVYYQDVISNNGSYGIWTDPIVQGNQLIGSLVTNNGDAGIHMRDPNSPLGAQAITVSNNLNTGIDYYTNAGYGTAISNAVVLNSTNGVKSDDGGWANTFTDLMSGYHTNHAITIGANTATQTNYFGGKLWVGNDGWTDCFVGATSSSNQLTNTCAYGPGNTAASGFTATSSFGGKVATNDLRNSTAQTNATATYAGANDWTHFQNSYRTWGKSGAGALLSAGLQGNCASGTCQIFDWSNLFADTQMKNYFGTLTNGAACPPSVDASVAANVLTSGSNHLRAAIEVMDPVLNPNGNFNGLCEANEACIYTPNVGGYQGQGDFTTQTCTFTGGNGVTNVTMYGYPFNGGDSYGAQIYEDHPWGYYRFNETSGTVAKDYSGNGRDGAYSGETLGGANIVTHNTGGGSVTGSGSTNYVAVNGAPYPTNKVISAECWVKPTAADLPGYARPVLAGFLNNGNQGILLGLDGRGYGFFETCGIFAFSGAGSIVAGNTYHLAGTYDTATMSVLFYLNGAQVGTGSVGFWCDPWAALNSNTLYLGGVPNGGVNGQVAECAVYNSVLTPAQILNHYNSGK